jgi:DNA-binding NarL/FixJ family response regulator
MSNRAIAALQPVSVPAPKGQVIPFPTAARRRTDGADANLVRVLVAHGQGLMRAAFRVLLSREHEIRVAAVAADGDEAVALARRDRPDVVLMDIDLPGLGAVEATPRMLADPKLAEVKVLIVAASEGDQRTIEALRAGASGVLFQCTEAADLIQAVRVLARGRALIAPGITGRLVAEVASGAAPLLNALSDHQAPALPIALPRARRQWSFAT